MKVLIIGAKGQLGTDLVHALASHSILTPEHGALDVTDSLSVDNYMQEHRPDAVINTSAFHDVPLCESDPASCFAVNAIGPRNLAVSCSRINAQLYHISTDYVFNGEKGSPYIETDTPSPLMVYGAAKLAGEHLSMSNWVGTRILRTTGLFGTNPCRAKPGGRNFVSLMLHLGRQNGEVKVVSDQLCCPTYTPDLAGQIVVMVEKDVAPGVYHVVTPPGCSWFDTASLVFKAANMDVNVNAVSSAAFPASFRRPADSRLLCNALDRMGIMQMRPIEEAIAEYVGVLLYGDN